MRLVNKLDLDNPTLLCEHGSWKHAKHIQISEDGKYSENEDKLVDVQSFPSTHISIKYLGKIVIPDDVILFYHYKRDDINYLKITKQSQGNVGEIRINDPRYEDQEVHGTYNYNHKGELTITFGCRNTEDNTPEILIINIDKLAGSVITPGTEEYNDILLNPNYFSKIPTIDFNSIQVGGTLLTGTYFLSICYEDEDGNRSDFTSLSNPIVLSDGEAKVNLITDKYETVDKNKKSEQATNKSILVTINNLKPKYSYIRLAILYYTDNTLQSISLTPKINIISDIQTYTIRSIGGLQNLALEQIIINNTKYIKSKSIVSNANKLLLYNLKTDNNHFETFQNIANNIVIDYHKDKVFRSQQLNIYNPNTEILNFINPKDIYYNKPFKSGETYCFYIGFKYVKGGYISVNHIPAYANSEYNSNNKLLTYNNESSLYPIDFPKYANQPVACHKFPEFEEIQGNRLIGNNGFWLLGINVKNVVIPDEIKHICSGWEIFYAERTSENITRLGQGVRLARSNVLYSFDLQYTNFPLSLIDNFRRLHLFNNVNVTGYYNINNTLNAIGPSNPINEPNLNKVIKLNKTTTINSINNVPISVVIKGEYKSGIDAEDFQEDLIRLEIISNDLNAPINIPGFIAGMYEIETTNKNLYSNPFSQVLVSTGVAKSTNHTFTGNIYGGDTYISRMATKIANNRLQVYAVESIYNIELRHEGMEEWQKLYPQSSYQDIIDMPTDKGSYINDDFGNSYDKTYGKLNNINNPMVDIKQLDDIFPNRIAISDVNQTESTRLGWRIFRPNNYYDMPFNRGEGIKLTSADKQLFIQNRYGLYHAQIKDVLQLADGSQAWLGTGDLFDRPPQEIMYKDAGGIGCRDYHSALYTEFGYIVCDRDHDAIYAVRDKVEDLTLNGFKKWFRDQNSLINSDDNILIGYDELRKRLLIRDKTNYTISYSLLSQGLTSFHDYIYKDIAVNRRGTFLIEDNLIRKFTKKPTNLKSYIDVNVLFEPNIQKLFQSIIWETEYLIDKHRLWDKTIDKIMVYNDSQCTGLLDVNTNKMWYKGETGVYKADQWIFNDIFDAVINDREPFLENFMPTDNVSANKKNWYNMSQFISKFITIRLHSDNNNNQRIRFLNLYIQLSKDSR